MKKFYVLFAVLAIAALALSACGGDGSKPQPSTNASVVSNSTPVVVDVFAELKDGEIAMHVHFAGNNGGSPTFTVDFPEGIGNLNLALFLMKLEGNYFPFFPNQEVVLAPHNGAWESIAFEYLSARKLSASGQDDFYYGVTP